MTLRTILASALTSLLLVSCSGETHGHEEFHIHAGFHIYVDGDKQDYSDSSFMYFMPCSLDDDEKMTAADRVHLHDNIGDVAHIHSEGVTWGTLFESLKIDTDATTVTGYVEGQVVPDVLNEEIKPLDSAVLFLGEVQDVETALAGAVPKERILEIESNTYEKCGKNK